MGESRLIDQVLEISQDYLGPAAERFIDRQVAAHLHKKPDNVTSDDLLKLVDWLKLSFALLTDDRELVNEYARRLRQIARSSEQSANGKL